MPVKIERHIKTSPLDYGSHLGEQLFATVALHDLGSSTAQDFVERYQVDQPGKADGNQPLARAVERTL